MREKNRAGSGAADPLTTGFLVGGETLHQSPSRPQALNWRDYLDVHPVAELFPLLSETDPAALKELAEDIKQHGQREPASYIKDSDGNRVLLDGRNRLDALEMLGRKIDVNDSSMFEQRSISINAQAFIISKNIHRRHLNAEDKRDLIAKLLKAKPETSNRQIATQVKVDHKTVATVRKEKESTGEIPQLKKTVGVDGKARKRPAAKAKPQNDRPAWATEVLDLVAKGEASMRSDTSHPKQKTPFSGQKPKPKPRARNPDDEEGDIEADIEPDNRRLAFLLRADQARLFAVYSGPIDQEVIEVARAAALAWKILTQKSIRELMPTATEAEESYQEILYDQACLLLESMASETRERFFAHIKENYQSHSDCDGAGVTPADGLDIPDLKRAAP